MKIAWFIPLLGMFEEAKLSLLPSISAYKLQARKLQVEPPSVGPQNAFFCL